MVTLNWKNPIAVYDVHINKILVSNKVSFGEKGFQYFTSYKDCKKVKLICVMLPKMSACRREFDEAQYMPFLIKNDELLEKYKENWDKVSNTIKKRFDSEPVYNEKYLRTKIKSYNG